MRKALIVGIDDYPTCPLHACGNDADAMGNILERNEDGSINFHIKKEINVSSKAELRHLIKDCFSGDEDIALFYYSGHGYIDSIGGYLVTPDYTDDDYGVSLNDVLTIANKSRCKDRIIILDSCHAGFLGSINVSDQNTAVINEGVTILAASRASEPSLEIGDHGLFTSLLLEALKGSAADLIGNITPGGIYAYIDKALGPWSQRPVFKTNVTRFTSLRNVIPQIDINIIRNICDFFPSEEEDFHLDPSFEPTNSPAVEHDIVLPYANRENTEIFSKLQAMEGVGLVVPVGEKHMYFAAMNSKSCVLTSLGKQYWRLVHRKLI